MHAKECTEHKQDYEYLNLWHGLSVLEMMHTLWTMPKYFVVRFSILRAAN